MPVEDSLKMTRNDYRNFISSLGSSARYWKNWMNNYVFKDGVRFPYHPDEFLTDLRFQEKSAHMFFEIKDGMTDLLKKDFWVN